MSRSATPQVLIIRNTRKRAVRVHLANAIGNQNPTWQFGVVAAATQNLNLVYHDERTDAAGPIDSVLGP